MVALVSPDRHDLYVRAMRTLRWFDGGTLTVGVKGTTIEDNIRLGICLEELHGDFGKLQGKPERVDRFYCLLDTKHDMKNGATLVLDRMGVFVRGHVWLNRDGSLETALFYFTASYHTIIYTNEAEDQIPMQYEPRAVSYEWAFRISTHVREYNFEVPLASIPGFSPHTLVVKFNFPNMPQ